MVAGRNCFLIPVSKKHGYKLGGFRWQREFKQLRMLPTHCAGACKPAHKDRIGQLNRFYATEKNAVWLPLENLMHMCMK